MLIWAVFFFQLEMKLINKSMTTKSVPTNIINNQATLHQPLLFWTEFHRICTLSNMSWHIHVLYKKHALVLPEKMQTLTLLAFSE